MSNIVTKHISVLSRRNDGATLELNMVSYNGNTPTWDLRRWGYDNDCQKVARKGLVLSDEEIKALKAAINTLDI